MSAAPTSNRRIVSVDVLRGVVILALVPDLGGGFAFHAMADRHADSVVWRTLANWFSHVPWAGMSLWDLVMPAFVTLVGVSLALSTDRRQEQGAPAAQRHAAAVLRAANLCVLGMLLPMQRRSLLEASLPYAILAAALPWSEWAERAGGRASAVRDRVLDLGLPTLAVTAVSAWLLSHPDRLGAYDFNNILTQFGLAYLPAYALRGQGIAQPLWRAGAILVAWGLAFALYAPPPGLQPVAPAWDGAFSHWNNGTNLAAGLDRWLFAGLPRSEPYQVNPHGYHTLEAVPLIASMLVGVAVARCLRQAGTRAPRLLFQAALAAIVAGMALGAVAVPIVKSLWTPSWALLSGGLVVMVLAALARRLDGPGPAPRWVWLLAAPGANTMLLYVIASSDRWRIVLYTERLTGTHLAGYPAGPLLEALLVMAVLWALALAAHRLRVFIKV